MVALSAMQEPNSVIPMPFTNSRRFIIATSSPQSNRGRLSTTTGHIASGKS
jgi:hypothetical protein